MTDDRPVTLHAPDLLAISGSSHPVPSASQCAGRQKQRLGDPFEIDQYGVNRVTLDPGAWSTIRHWHSHEDEFVYVLSGSLILVTDRGETAMAPGDCAGFKAGVPDGHRLENRSNASAVYLEIGSRRLDVDETYYSDDDLMVGRDAEGRQVYKRRDGTILGLAE